MTCESKIHTDLLPEEYWRRGPGGHWYRYRAFVIGFRYFGYGQTALEAIKDLRAKR